ncbi:MAG: hypothetical protein ACLPYZ_09960 [Limisphaerales bacterium]
MTNNTPVGSWSSVASSADGTQLAAVGPYVYTSTNSGATWVSNSLPAGMVGVASSADGNKLACASGSAIYTSYSIPSPQLDLTPTNGNLTLSWLVASTNFVLQQNSDLTTANWATLTNVPTLNLTNLQDQVILSPANSSGFFRLISQ